MTWSTWRHVAYFVPICILAQNRFWVLLVCIIEKKILQINIIFYRNTSDQNVNMGRRRTRWKDLHFVYNVTTGFKKAAFSSNAKSPNISTLSSWSWCMEASRRKEWIPAKSPPDPRVHQKMWDSKNIKTMALITPMPTVAFFWGIDIPTRKGWH